MSGRRCRRVGIGLLAASAALALGAGPAAAAIPAVGAGSAANLQGVSALLESTVDPEGLATTYRFEYVSRAGFETSGFAAARSTRTESAGSGGDPRPVSAAIAALSPATEYRFRVKAANASGTATGPVAAFATTAGFGFLPGSDGFSAQALAEGGEAATLAGSHPYQLSFEIGLREGGEFKGQPGVPFTDGDLRDLRIEMPHGLLENPAALPRCSGVEFNAPRESPFEASRSGESCPAVSQIGVVEVSTSANGGETRRFGAFNLAPPPGVPSQIGFAPFGKQIVLSSRVRRTEDGTYALALEATDFPQTLDVRRISLTIWGVPWGVSHNGERGNCLNEAEPDFPWAKCSVGPPSGNPPLAYLTLPTTCEGPLTFVARARSWQQSGAAVATAASRDRLGDPAELEGCGGLIFDPHPVGRLTDKKASSPTGFNFQLTTDNEAFLEPRFRAQSQARRAVVRLPDGVTLNPSVGAGLGVCTPAEYARETARSAEGQGCPNAAKIGAFGVETPLFDERIEGAIYLAQPDDPGTGAPGAENPFDSLLAIYLVGRAPGRGVLVTLPGRLDPDSGTGRLTAVFDNLPELPYTNLEMNFREGQRAPMITPPSCGTHYTSIEMTPWVGTAQTAKATSESHVQAGVGGGPCPAGGTPPFAPGASAGALNSNVGSYTPYFVHLTRKDTEQEITSYSLVLPRGISGKLAGIPFCPEAAIAAARVKSGAAETAEPSCPAASQVGRTISGYGVGPALTYAPGKIYLAGPYNGAPLSLVIVNAATVGPFDLGTVVIRDGFSVDRRTAQLAIDARASDRIPHIIDGIPLHLRDIRVYVDRPEFTRNPTSCEPSQLVSTLTGSGARFEDPGDDSTTTTGVHFQMLNCGTLGYKPKLGLKLRGGVRRGDYPSLQAVVQGRPGDANLKDFNVTMPHSLFLAQSHIRGICTMVQFNAQQCPANSVYGRATAFTPLFDEPLRGNVYLRSSNNRLPDLVASLYSGAVHIVVEGRIGPARGGIKTEFTDLPDAPLTRFVMVLRGGRHGLLENSANLCTAPPFATVRAIGQNNRGAAFSSQLRGERCREQRRGGKGKGKRNGKGKSKGKGKKAGRRVAR